MSFKELLQGDKFTIEYLGKNLYRILLESQPLTLTGSADILEFRILKLWRLSHVEWSFDDATAKDLIMYLLHSGMKQLGYPTRILDLAADINEDGFLPGGDSYEMEPGCMFRVSVDGTAGKFFNIAVYIQILEK
ncbi:hypothetical protein KAR91_45865 [Candidatus Pacearchaeota archaeon]|nr:hypothetical protein [Candidatus Pacearchaeota archaeon]